MIDEEVSKIVNEAYKIAQDILQNHKPALDRVVKELLEKETLERDEFAALVDGKEKVIDEGQV